MRKFIAAIVLSTLGIAPVVSSLSMSFGHSNPGNVADGGGTVPLHNSVVFLADGGGTVPLHG